MSLSERLGPSRAKELASFLLKVEFPAPTRRIMEPLLEMLVGGQSFDLSQNYLIREPAALLLLLELIPSLSEELQLDLWSTLGAMLHQCLHNISSCHNIGMTEKCLDYLAKTKNTKIANHIGSVLELLSGYSLTVKHLKSILSYLYNGQSDTTWAPHSVLLISLLNNVTINRTPDAFFSFSGGHGSVFALPPVSKWPSQTGFTVSMWIRSEQTYDSQRDYYKPILYWFRSGRGSGYSAHFVGSTLVLETVGKQIKKPQTHPVDHVFHSFQWYMITVVYTAHRLRSSEVQCYVDGVLSLTAEVTLPLQEEIYDKCFLGGNHVATPDSVFQGQMAALYIWRIPLSRDPITSLYKLGSNYRSQFKFEAEVDMPLTMKEQKLLFDGSLSNSLIISYNAKAVDGQLCLEASPTEGHSSVFAHSPHATMLEGVEPVLTTSIHSALHSLGGIQALFPLFSQLDTEQLVTLKGKGVIDYSLSVKLLSLVFELARNSTTYMYQLVQMSSLIPHLLGKVSPLHLSGDLLSVIFDFLRYLSKSPYSEELIQPLVVQLLFNASLWIRASKKVQIHLYSHLATEFCMSKLGTTSLDLRDIIGVNQLMFILKEHYTLTNGKKTNKDIRPYLILMIKQFVTKGKGIRLEELVSILNFLLSVPEEENLFDVLQLLIALVFEDSNTSLIKLLKNCGGLKVAAKLLACSSEELRINALKLISKVLHHSSERERESILEQDGYFIVVKEKLLSSGQPVTIPMFNTLLQLLLDQPSRRVIENHYYTIDPSHCITFEGLLPVMLATIHNLNDPTDDELDRSDREGSNEDSLFKEDSMKLQLLTYINTLCTQNNRNCLAVLKIANWKELFLKFCDDNEDSDSLQSLLYQLFHTLLMYALKEEEEGWRLWTQIAATIHSFRVKKGLATHRYLSSSSSVKPVEGGETPAGRTDSQSSLTPQSVRALYRPRTASRTKVTDDDSELESQSEISLSDFNTTSATGLEITGTESTQPISPLVESTLTANTTNTNTDINTDSNTDPKADTNTDPKANTNTTVAAPRSHQSLGKKKYPKFVWSVDHWNLFKQILNSIQNIIDKWNDKSVTERANANLIQNTVQLLVLNVDSFIIMIGGIKNLVTEACGINKRRSRRISEEKDSVQVETVLRQCLFLCDALILNNKYKYNEIETRMNMETGGVLRQCLRLILVVSSLDCIKANNDYEDQQSRYHKHKIAIEQMKQQSQTILKSVGMTDTSLDKYVAGSLENKLVSLKDCQLLLNHINIHRIQRVIPKELESRSLLQPILSSIFYFLSVLCVAKYKSILDSVEKERADLSLPRRQRSSTSSNGSQSPQLSLELGSLPLEDTSPPPPPLTPDTVRFSRSDSLSSSVASASDLKEVPPGDKPMQFFGAEGILHPPTTVPLNQAVDVSEQVSVSLRLAGGCLCQVLVDHKSVLSKVLTSVDGRNLLSEAALKLAESNSTVEITMLLCSQEWQTSLQKTAAKYFTSLITEGRHITHISESFIRSLAMNVSQNIKSNQEMSTNIFTKYEEGLSLFISDIIKDTLVDRKMRKAELLRHAQTAEALWRKLSPMVDNCGSFDFTPLKHSLLWRLDLKEDSHRRRLKTLPNHNGSTHSNAVRSNPEQQAMEDKSSFDPNLLLSPLPADEDDRVGEEEGDIVTENKETPRVILDCSMIFLSYVVPGTLSFTKQYFTFTADDSSTEYNKVSQICDYCPLSDQWLLVSVTAVFSRYYIHQFKALEIFFNDKSSIFIVLKSPLERKTVINLLPKVGIGPNYGLPQTRSVSLAPPKQLFKRSVVTDKWIKSEISNFDYLMFLNTIAGRSFNDLSQYPVFPWILKDYKSKAIDLKDPAIYRDLTKPIGCLNPSRLDQYLERYEMWESDSIPSFHYGTHYSTMAFVVHWLVRVEPFTSIHIDLHDGFFDHGSRLFSSIARAWNNCQVDSSDVKELIPELFYLPEMLQNNNKFVLGFDEHGEFGEELPEGQVNTVNDVLLPPWAENAEKFIEIHRQALESDYVSANIHHWIDLIFGYKQNGPEAIKSANVFYHITYPGSVNWQAITDEYQLKGLEQQVLQFGVTPHQLLLEPHPQKHSAIKEFPPQPKSKFNPAIVAEVNVSLDVPIGCLHLTSSHSLIAITYNQLFGIYKWNYTQGTMSQPPQISLEHDQSHTASLKVRLGDPLDQSVSFSSSCFDVTPAGDYILSSGFWDSSFKVFSTETGLSVQSVFAHRGIVSCISFSPEEGVHSLPGDALVATGSHDVTVLLWRWSGRYNRIVNQLGTSTQSSVNPIAILNGHERTITCVAVSASHGLVASGAKHSCCLVHSTNGELLHKLVPSNPWTHPHIIRSSPQGHFIVHYADQKGCLAVFSCNGKQLCYKGLGEPALAVSVSHDGQYLVIGGFSSRVYVLLMESLSVVYAYDKNESSIRSLHMSKDNRFIFIGHSSGIVSVFATHFWRT